jgi:hypothetical protein
VDEDLGRLQVVPLLPRPVTDEDVAARIFLEEASDLFLDLIGIAARALRGDLLVTALDRWALDRTRELLVPSSPRPHPLRDPDA